MRHFEKKMTSIAVLALMTAATACSSNQTKSDQAAAEQQNKAA